MKKFWVFVLLSVLAIGCTPAPQPSGGGVGGGSSSTTTSNTTTSNTTAE